LAPGGRFDLPTSIPGASRLWFIDDFLMPDMLSGLRQLFEYDGHWRDSYGLSIDNLRAENVCGREEWEAADDKQRLWFFEVIKDGFVQGAPFAGWAHWIMLRKALESQPLLLALAERAALPAAASVSCNALRLGYGHYLRPHADDFQNRQLCGAFYVTDGWQRGYGGEFVMNANGESLYTVEPKTNRLVLFDLPEQAQPKAPRVECPLHWIAPLTEKAGDWKRGSISIWWMLAQNREGRQSGTSRLA
jgi:hypothetical protein